MKAINLAVVALALLLAVPGLADNVPACRDAGHPCEGNQSCCEGLVCVASGPGSAKRCAPCPDGQIGCASACIPACEATDQCHQAGECDPTTGTCTTPAVEDGTPCDDGNACTQTDTCQGGSCGGSNPVACSASDQCHEAGECDPNTGICSDPAKPDGAACDADGDACTAGDSCQDGECAAGSPPDCEVCNACSGGDCQPVDSDSGCATVCCNGSCCGAGEECVDNACQSTCLEAQDPCQVNSQCCQTPPTSCAPANPNCYATGTDPFNQCCHDTNESCGNDCDCCALQLCEDGTCCKVAGGSCSSESECCDGIGDQTCFNGRCCVLEGHTCEGPDDCCAGMCGPDGFCQGCLGLQQACEADDNQCCQDQEATSCDEIGFGSEPSCCRPPGGACNENDDCCRGGTCCNGQCCDVDNECVDNACQGICRQHGERCLGAQCCDGLECRYRLLGEEPLCRDATCSEALEMCDKGGTTVGRQCCEGDESCQSAGLFQHCCSSLGGECHDLGRFFPGGDCCGDLVCNGVNQCAPCRKAGETCQAKFADGSFSNCCNTAFADHPLVCFQGHCAVCPESGEACVDFGSGPTCCNGLIPPCNNGICR